MKIYYLDVAFESYSVTVIHICMDAFVHLWRQERHKTGLVLMRLD